MQDERNQNQIIRKDARECFVESLSDAFSIGKAHFAFATYDVSRPAGQRHPILTWSMTSMETRMGPVAMTSKMVMRFGLSTRHMMS